MYKKIFISFLLITLFLSSMTVPNVYAEDISIEDQILDTTDEVIDKILDKASITYTYNYLKNETIKNRATKNNFDKELNQLGVTALTANQAKEIINNKPGIKQEVPRSSLEIAWYSKRFNHTYKGKKYSIQKLYAQGMCGGTGLANGKNDATLYTGTGRVVNDLSVLASVYAQKIIGSVPAVKWAPFELLFSNNENTTSSSHTVTYRSLQTYCYIYVKPYGKSDDYQELCWSSNKVQVACTHILAGYRNGKAYTKSKDTNTTIKATNYGKSIKALERYVNSRNPKLSFVENYTFYNHNRKKYVKQRLNLYELPGMIM